MATEKSYKYQTEIKKMLGIVVNSLYTNKDIFVRELVSNAADALEKFRHYSLVKEDVPNKDVALEISIDLDKEAKTFTISDNGVGMKKDELVNNLGTIARSGSEEFMKSLEDETANPAQIIGQFGLGFYSSFMTSEKVEFITRAYSKEAKGWKWVSEDDEGFSITADDSAERGAKIICHLNDDMLDYADPENIKRIIKQYSNFVSFPIKVDGEQVNTVQAIWTQSPSKIEKDTYTEFYKFIANAFSDPEYTMHVSADAPIQLNALVFMPGENMESFGFSRMEPGVSLYCNRVLIESEVKELLPEYFRFVKGVVDSEDLPLNISRETLQDNRIIAKLKKFLTKRIIKFLAEEASKDTEKYEKWYQNFGMFIKEGVHSDYENQIELAKLLRFETSINEAGDVASLDEYVEGMPEGQEHIYFITGGNREQLDASPYMEIFKQKGFEVLYLFDNVDDFVLSSLREYGDKKIVSADQADLKLDDAKDEEKTEDEEKKEENATDILINWIKDNMKNRISDVKVSNRLVESPAILVNPDDNMTTHMQKILAATQKHQQIEAKILEINPTHALVKNIITMAGEDSKSDKLRMYVEQLVDSASMIAGLPIDTEKMVDRMYKIMQ